MTIVFCNDFFDFAVVYKKGEIFIGNFDDGKMNGEIIYTNIDEIDEKRLYNKGVLVNREKMIE